MHTDPDYLEEALLELSGNALRALGEGGVVRLESEAGPAKIVIRVIDSGPGIPESVQPRIFDLFFTTRADGSGVGLAAVRRSIERLGGEVRLVESRPGHTCFELAIPGAPPP